MRLTELALCVSILPGVAACKGSNHAAVDAAIIDSVDAPVPADAMIDAAPTPVGCDVGEQNDQGNDDLGANGVAEATGVSFTTAATVCGNINGGHFATMFNTVDVDSYGFAVPADSDLLISLSGAGIAALDSVQIVLSDGQNGFGTGTFLGDHGVFSAHVPAGSYEISVIATNAADITAPVPYRLEIVADTPATRCPKITAAASYTEALDTAANNQAGNDVVEVRFTTDPATNLTAGTTDMPEPTGLTLAPATNYRITGTAKLPTGTSPDEYLERDTYLVTTGATTNQLAIRLNWPGTTTDFDYLVFPEITNTTDTPVEIVASTTTQMGEDEFATFSVLPNTNYWLWIAPYNTTPGTSSAALPVTYDASICGERFTVP